MTVQHLLPGKCLALFTRLQNQDEMKPVNVLLAAALCGSLLCCKAAAPEGSVAVKLSKKPLEVERIVQQRETLKQKFALGSSNRGEDIPLLDFMDAQVSLVF